MAIATIANTPTPSSPQTPWTTIVGALANGFTTVNLADGSAFPSSGRFAVVVDNNIFHVTRSGNVLTLVEHEFGEATHADGAEIWHIDTVLSRRLYPGVMTTPGDTVYLNAALAPARLAAPADGDYVTRWTSGVPSWVAAPTANPGTVTSVALSVPSFLSVAGSPITASGTLAVTLQNQNANLVFAGPATGSAAAPTFRALVAADIAGLVTPGGSSGAVQYNNAGAFGGFGSWDGTTGLNLGGDLSVTSVPTTGPTRTIYVGQPLSPTIKQDLRDAFYDAGIIAATGPDDATADSGGFTWFAAGGTGNYNSLINIKAGGTLAAPTATSAANTGILSHWNWGGLTGNGLSTAQTIAEINLRVISGSMALGTMVTRLEFNMAAPVPAPERDIAAFYSEDGGFIGSFRLDTGIPILWPMETPDVGLVRSASGTLKVIDGTTGLGALTVGSFSTNGKSITLSGNFTTTGAFNPTFAIPSSSTWTFPSGGGTLLATVYGTGVATALAAALDGTGGLASKSYVDSAVTGLLDFKGSTDASANPNYPSASKGDAYYISAAGRIGGASGKQVEIGDVYVASADNAGGTEASVGTSWFVLEHNLVGAVISGGALGTPSSGTLTNCTIPIGGVSGLGTNVATFLATPSSANLIAAVTDETGSGALVFANTPTLVTPVLGDATGTSLALGTNPATAGAIRLANAALIRARNSTNAADRDLLGLSSGNNVLLGDTSCQLNIQTNGNINIANANDFIFATSTGSKIGTGSTQKIGFWGVAPVAQQVLATGAGKVVDDVITFLQTVGLCKQS